MTRPLPLAAATLALASTLSAQSLRYAPGEFKYTALIVIKQNQVLGAQSTKSTVTSDERMSLLLAPRGTDSLRFRLALDQWTLSADVPIQLQDFSALQGTVVEGAMTGGGRLAHYTYRSPAGTGPDVAAHAQQMSQFLIVLPRGPLTGRSWSDTTVSPPSSDGTDLAERTITTTVVAGDTMYAGERAWRLRRETTFTRQGTMLQGTQRLAVSAQASGQGTYYISARGVFLGARTTMQSSSTITLADGQVTTLAQDATSVIALTP
jgi:hypothetical protein